MSDLLIRNEPIQAVFSWYMNEKFWVNRKYQRKLVWTLAEKSKFINSIMRSYPVPLFLLAETSQCNEQGYEIIDGMQRLEAVFSFLRGDYSVTLDGENGFFDLSTMAETKALLDSNEIQQNTPVLSRKMCVDLANYQIPLSITRFQEEEVEEIFRRINATGRLLSHQDLRQAGATEYFSELVRKISSQIRRDTSPSDRLPLSKMREISLSSSKLPYGINLKDVFWVRQQIITVNNMRLSRDEELISYLLMYILLGDKIDPTAKNLDEIYGAENNSKNIINDIAVVVEREGEKEIIERFIKVFDEFERVLEKSNRSFSWLVFGDESHAKVRTFQVVFLAFYKLLTNGKILVSIDRLIEQLSGIGKREFNNISSRKWTAKYRNEKINAIEGIIKDCFMDSEQSNPAVDNWVSKLENILMQSKIEQQLFDFKVGVYDFCSRKYNEQCIRKCVKTLTAMANMKKNTTGYILLGVADDKKDADKHKKLYGTKPKSFNNFFIVGVDGEVEKYHKSMDEYYNRIKQVIEKEPVDDYIISYITRNMRLVNYYDRSIVVLSLQSKDKPLLYDQKYYERRGANNHRLDVNEVSPPYMADLFSRFQ
ncbi:DUF262 domain-containing protein [Selenomonas sputigena]|uniref:DUF262 domain-containing protein n=1 Tax=Selenomonas sputigena TaxID=69823 RepID=UPI002234B6E7|nr:DUF262 domain-containing protein [Selenomonas sputigena]UZE45135.1 DUF262 domain-containing protein [Selenomonas sputigena]